MRTYKSTRRAVLVVLFLLLEDIVELHWLLKLAESRLLTHDKWMCCASSCSKRSKALHQVKLKLSPTESPDPC